jgi:hypothetical protein
MPDLLTSLHKHDLGYLRIVAESWGLDLDSNETESAAKELSASLLDPNLLAETIEILSPEADSALTALTENSGRIPWVEFKRRYGDIREMGPGKRDREKPHRNPTSSAETLFYRALLARAFFDTPNGPQEFAYIPDDLHKLIHHGELGEHRENTKEVSVNSVDSVVNSKPLGRPALPREKAQPYPATDHILDNATTLLAALRMGRAFSETEPHYELEKHFLIAAGILKNDVPQPEGTKAFLEASRKGALKTLTDAWLSSDSFNELRMLPGLSFEGDWKNDPRATREFLLKLLSAIPKDKWWSLSAFVQDIKEKHPDFQRPAGDYDSWFIKRQADDEYLRGFENWNAVDGNLVQFIIVSILSALGRVDVARPGEMEPSSAFRVRGKLPVSAELEKAKLSISSQGLILIPRLFSRAARYQIARFCAWEEHKWENEYRYRVTPESLQNAQKQGLKVEQLLSLLAKYSKEKIPPSLVKALKRWDENGTEARVQNKVVLRVSRPEVLEELRKSRASRFLGEILGPTAVVVRDGAQSKVLEVLAEIGLLAEEEK